MTCSKWRPTTESSSDVGSLNSVVSSSNASLAHQDSGPVESSDSLEVVQTFDETYSLENMIGCGSYAKVYRCVSLLTNQNFAVKVIEDKMLSGYQRQLIRNEEGILKRLDHRNVIKLVAVFVHQQDVKRMVFEFADQLDVCLALVTDPSFGERSIKGIVHQLFDGLNYLHSEGIIHRDLKLENLLVKSDIESNQKVLKICDFGYAVVLTAGQTFFTMKNIIIGSFEYMSPELISRQEYSAQIDCWAAGVIVYFLFTGDFPFKGSTVTEMVRCIVKRQFTLDFASAEWAAASSNAVNFIRSILEPLYTRPNITRLLRHAWFTDPPDQGGNRITDLPLPIMRQRERLEFLQHEAEMKLKRLYNNSSSNKPTLLAGITCWSTGIAMRRHRHCYCGVRSHEATFTREFLVNTYSRRRSRSFSVSRRGTIDLLLEGDKAGESTDSEPK